MKIKVSELKGKNLAEWAARAQKWEEISSKLWLTNDGFQPKKSYRPDINGGQAMELAKKFGLVVNFETGEVYLSNDHTITNYGSSNSIIEVSICRAVVASVFGEEVDDGKLMVS